MTRKIRFALIGAGWRAMYYVRIAKALPDLFELCVILCRTEEKAGYMRQTYHIETCTDENELIHRRPDFIVIAAAKDVNPLLSMKWTAKGFYVLQETPAANDMETLKKLAGCEEAQNRLVIAEQYRFYPENLARMNLIRKGMIGEPRYLYLSLAHDYHAASLMRSFLYIPAECGFSLRAQEWSFPLADTLSRYERITTGTIGDHKRTAAMFTFDNGTACLYDFDSEQYRSPIASSHFRLQGIRGEIADDTVSWLDENNLAKQERIVTRSRTVTTGSSNPNLSEFQEITGIFFQNEELYSPPFAQCGLSQDETAIARMLKQMDEYIYGSGNPPYPLSEALYDAYMALLMRKAVMTKTEIHSDTEEFMQ